MDHLLQQTPNPGTGVLFHGLFVGFTVVTIGVRPLRDKRARLRRHRAPPLGAGRGAGQDARGARDLRPLLLPGVHRRQAGVARLPRGVQPQGGLL